ncbi:hypothetical protein [Dethiothermospora halolimnae]|uniref:hypothetical protein n=1 Tax=Dethiothermospora halolimnae TaxID=3114390 RepID=UPI003CCBE62A
MNREKQVSSIINYVDNNKNSIESKRICTMILGEKDREVNDELIKELHARLPRAKQDVLNSCYNIIE